MSNNIDIVLTWVNNKDPEWLKDYLFYLDNKFNKEIAGQQRFEHLESLQYIFRGVENFLPWVRQIHFVTAEHVPDWLNLDHPKLHLISHSQIFSEKSYLPTFNSNAIEMCFLNIPDLAEKFIYFNDDMFVVKPLNTSRFFAKNIPKDFFALKILHHDGIFSHGLHSTMRIINKEIKNKKKFFFSNFFKIFNINYGIKINFRNFLLIPFTPFSLFQIYHHPQPLLKSSLIEIIKKYPVEINNTRASRFKSPTDVSPYIFRFINLVNGKFSPFYPRDTFYFDVKEISELKNQLVKVINKKNINFVCFNEHPDFDPENYETFKRLIREYLDSVLPDKSSYEK